MTHLSIFYVSCEFHHPSWQHNYTKLAYGNSKLYIKDNFPLTKRVEDLIEVISSAMVLGGIRFKDERTNTMKLSLKTIPRILKQSYLVASLQYVSLTENCIKHTKYRWSVSEWNHWYTHLTHPIHPSFYYSMYRVNSTTHHNTTKFSIHTSIHISDPSHPSIYCVNYTTHHNIIKWN